MSSEPIVFIVDDDEILLKCLSVVVESAGLRSKTFPSAEAFLREFDPEVPGCLILDVQMPAKGGLELQEALCRLPQCPPIIFMTGDAFVPSAVQAMKLGAVDFLEKPFSKSILLEAVHRAIAKDAADRERITNSQKLTQRFAELSRAEHDVLELVLRGETNKKIAAMLDISIRTVEDRRARLMEKLKVDTVAELIRLAVQAGLWKPSAPQ